MPRSPTRTSTGSPGTNRIATKVTNISATKVGTVSARRRSRKRSIGQARVTWRPAQAGSSCRTGRSLLQIHPVELVGAERALLEAGHVGAHDLVDHRVRDLEAWRLVVVDHLHLLVQLRALLHVGNRARLLQPAVKFLVAPLAQILSARARGLAAKQEEEVVRVSVVPGPAQHAGDVLALLHAL